jgi:biopolymer transport protein TolR
MSMSGGAGRNEVRSEINVTPLVDVCLVLLIIFMVVGPMIGTGALVVLPTGDNPPKKPQDSKQVVLAQKADKTLWLDRKELTPDQVCATLTELFQRAPGKEVVLKADARLDYGEVKRTVKLITSSGYPTVGLLAERSRK